MALKSTVHKAEVQIANLDTHYYATHNLTIAKHPSETDERMMLRVLAFVLHADECLEFGKGLSTDDEPDLWQKSLSDEIELWIDLGLPDERRLRQAAGRADQVQLYTYGDRSEATWWPTMQSACRKLANLSVSHVDDASSQALADMAAKNMRLQFTLQEGETLVTDGNRSLTVAPVIRIQQTLKE